MLVYRYEHNGVGPYSHGRDGRTFSDEQKELSQRISAKHNGSSKHIPIMSDTHCAFNSKVHICGCDSLASLRSWFKGFNTKLLKTGFKLAVYEVNYSDIIWGKSYKQLAFPRHLAKKV